MRWRRNADVRPIAFDLLAVGEDTRSLRAEINA
jgi:hypothetical protein